MAFLLSAAGGSCAGAAAASAQRERHAVPGVLPLAADRARRSARGAGRRGLDRARHAAASGRRSTSRRASPRSITTLQWRPKSLLVDGVIRGQDVTLKTTFDGTKASNVLAVQGAPQSKVDDVSADTVVLPNAFLGSYAALAMRLQGKTAGAELRAYIAPQAEVTVRVTAVVPEGISTPRGTIKATHYAMTFINPPPAGDLAVNLWADPDGRLLRMNIPAQQIEMAREDIASAASRTSAFSNPGDESVTIPSLGFNLAGTITKPKSDKPLPAVILVGGAGAADRDETVAGIPVFGHIARDLVGGRFLRRALRQARRRPERRASRVGDDRRLRRRRAPDRCCGSRSARTSTRTASRSSATARARSPRC